jgi:nucleolar protein 4
VKRNTKSSPLAHRPHPKSPSDPLAIRTIVISGLPKTIDSKSLWKKLRKYEGAEKVTWPIQTDSSDNTGIGESLCIIDTSKLNSSFFSHRTCSI